MTFSLANFQLDAIKKLLESMEEQPKDIILKSPTGSGKTIILTHFMSEYLSGHPNTVFIWLTPGKGNLEEQSKKKMDTYIHNSQTKLLLDVMNSGFSENDVCFINWEKLTKEGNNALKDSERTNFLEWIEKAFNAGLSFKLIIDESHQYFTDKANDVVKYFKTDKIIRCSATPIINNKATLIEISEEEVIAEGLIKKRILINENFPRKVNDEDQIEFLLKKALDKQQELHSLMLSNNIEVNPLIIVQIPNKSEWMLEKIEDFFEKEHINVESGTLAIWLSADHRNLDDIAENSSKQIAVIIKQAVATGWDCPRAHILVKLRDNMDETFEIQTIGRIRRMPEAHHYNNEILDSCYLYTFDSKFTLGVKKSLGKSAFNSTILFLKDEYRSFSLKKEQRTMVVDLHDPVRVLDSVVKFFTQEYKLESKKYDKNKKLLEASKFIFDEKIIKNTISGEVSVISDLKESGDFDDVSLVESINTHKHGRDHQQCVGRIGLEVGLEHSQIMTVLRRLFCADIPDNNKLLNLTVRQSYAFIINNVDLLRHSFRKAMSIQTQQLLLPSSNNISISDFKIPNTLVFTYDDANINQSVSAKNVYNGYLMSAEPRSSPEKKFEKYIEKSNAVDWFYKNGDKGEEYFSLVYCDNSGAQKLFYPDYILSINNQIWIIETKGGFDSSGESQNIDDYSEKKFNALKAYLHKYGYKGGFVRFDDKSEELCFSNEKYTEEMDPTYWKLLSDFI